MLDWERYVLALWPSEPQRDLNYGQNSNGEHLADHMLQRLTLDNVMMMGFQFKWL